MRLAWEFFKRDALIATSYRVSFVLQLAGNVLLLGVFYFIGQVVGQAENPILAPYGGNYLAFVLIGLALTDCVGVSLTTFATQIREGQLTGTLEAMLMSPARLPLLLAYSSLWAYFFSAVRFIVYIALGSLFYGVGLGQANLLGAVTIFVLTVLCFAGVGVLWASVVMLLKRGESLLTIAGLIVILISGVVFPREVLPSWVQYAAEGVPLAHALDAMRLAVLNGGSIFELARGIATLAVFAGILLPLGFFAFDRSVAIAKRNGSLVEY